MRPITLHLKSGERITGTPNYTTTAGVELRLSDGTFRWTLHEQVERWTRVRGKTEA